VGISSLTLRHHPPPHPPLHRLRRPPPRRTRRLVHPTSCTPTLKPKMALTPSAPPPPHPHARPWHRCRCSSLDPRPRGRRSRRHGGGGRPAHWRHRGLGPRRGSSRALPRNCSRCTWRLSPASLSPRRGGAGAGIAAPHQAAGAHDPQGDRRHCAVPGDLARCQEQRAQAVLLCWDVLSRPEAENGVCALSSTMPWQPRGVTSRGFWRWRRSWWR
jgi:hypothetical protein